MQEIRSGSTESITSTGLAEFRALLLQAERERNAISHDIAAAARDARSANLRFDSWSGGWLMRRMRPARFAEISRLAEEASAKLAELQEQMALAQLATAIDLPLEYAESFHQMSDAFSVVAASARIWDTLATRATNQRAERTVADEVISRELVRFGLGQADLLRCDWRVPHMENRNGGDLYLYPGFLLYRVSREAFAVIESKDVSIAYASCCFHETEVVPPDSDVIGETWSKANRDGSPDRRFRDNRRIPVVRYGQLTLTSGSGLHEVYLVSNAASAERFATTWHGHTHSLRS